MAINKRVLVFLILALAIESLPSAGAIEAKFDQLRIAGIVLKWIRGDRETTFARLETLVRAAAVGGAQIVCTTEWFLDVYALVDSYVGLIFHLPTDSGEEP